MFIKVFLYQFKMTKYSSLLKNEITLGDIIFSQNVTKQKKILLNILSKNKI